MGYRNFSIIIFFSFFFLLSENSYGISYPIHAFKSHNDSQVQDMNLVGVINSKSKLMSATPRLLDYDNRVSVVSGRLFDPSALRIGDTLYIIEKDPNHKYYKNGYIVGTGTVVSIFETEFMGWMFKAKGNFSMIHEGHFIAVPKRLGNRVEALALFHKGNRERDVGNLQQAFSFYKTSLQNDPEHAETYLEISLIAQKLRLQTEADMYLQEAWQRVGRFSDSEQVLRLPALYLQMKLRKLAQEKDNASRLQYLLSLKQELNSYYQQVQWYANETFKDNLKKNELLHYYTGLLYENIYFILNTNSLDKVMLWLSKSQRATLLENIHLSKEKILEPSKMWDTAFFQATLFHYHLAYQLNPLDGKAAYRLTLLAYQKLQRYPSENERKLYLKMIKTYGNAILQHPNPPAQMARVRQIMSAMQLD